MEGSSIAESTSTTSDTISASPESVLNLPVPKLTECAARVASPGTSVILDYEGGVEAESHSGRKLPSSRFKGVVPQPNGRWGAQIYEKHHRVWLGTFNGEEEAARAYDVAARRFRGLDAVTNFKLTSQTEESYDFQTAFLNSHSKDEIVDMLRKHTYCDELEQSKRNYKLGGGNGGKCVVHGGARLIASFDISDRSTSEIEQLFEKMVTPSDVGKLNRLVIPKQHAEKHFPLQTEAASKGILLNFEDGAGKVWRFRYSYWNSSQSYVLTKGWSRFVKEKSLKAGDIVSFQRSTGPDKQLYIDRKTRNNGSVVTRSGSPVQMVRLFGVNIVKTAAVGGVESKRRRTLEFETLENCIKKQRIINAL